MHLLQKIGGKAKLRLSFVTQIAKMTSHPKFRGLLISAAVDFPCATQQLHIFLHSFLCFFYG